MSATLSRSDPVPIPNVNDPISFTYKEIVRNLTANAPQPYGAIPPLMKKRKQKKKKRHTQQQPQAVRRMSHVENWVAVDSKESLPDEEDLIHSPFQNFLSVDFLTGILPLHMPPPSLSDPTTLQQQQEISKFAYQYRQNAGSSDSLKASLLDQDDDDDDDDDDDTENFTLDSGFLDGDDDDEEDEDEFDEEDDDDFSPVGAPGENSGGKQQTLGPAAAAPSSPLSLLPSTATTTALDTGSIDGNTLQLHKALVGRRSIPSFTKSHTPSTSTTTSYAISSSPPDQDRKKWIHTIAKLRQSLALSQPPPSTAANSFLTNSPASSASATTAAAAASGTGIFIATSKLSSKSLPSSLSSSPSSDTSTLNNDRVLFMGEKGPPPPQQQPPVLKKSSSSSTVNNNSNNNNNNKSGFIPMPLPPRRKRSTKKRRSEATTQPRFNVNTNTYTRDTRSNPDHLRMIAAELNMMRSRKLFSPLKPRGFLPRRKDPFICGDGRLRSPLQFELV